LDAVKRSIFIDYGEEGSSVYFSNSANQKFSYFLLIFTKFCGKLLPDGANDNYRCHLMKRNC
jgi:hypothetical protein